MTETTSLSGDERAEETSRAARDAEEEEQMKEGELMKHRSILAKRAAESEGVRKH